MHCRSCGADLPADAAYCSQCGARVELGSILGVGTDLPAVPGRNTPRDEPVPAASSDPGPAPESGREPEPDPGPESETAPEPTREHDLSQTRELPRLDPTKVPVAATPPPRQAPRLQVRAAAAGAPAAGASQPGTPTHLPVQPDPEPAHSRSSVLAMIATFAVLTIIGTFALTRLIGSGDPEPAAQDSPPASSSVEESGDPTPSTSEASPSESPSSAVSPSESTTIPADARRCSTSGNDSVATAYAGTERTSCEFAASVREAYRKAGSPAGATSLRAYSPVTKKWYSLSCDGGEPVRCVSTTNAIVILSP